MVFEERAHVVFAIVVHTLTRLHHGGKRREVAVRRLEASGESKIGRIVERSRQRFYKRTLAKGRCRVEGFKPTSVRSDVVGVIVKNLADSVHTGRLRKFGPEILANVLHGINTNAVEGVVFDETTNPRVPGADNVRVLSVDICKRQVLVTKPALLDSCLIIVVVRGLDEAEAVIVGLLVKWLETAEVGRI